MAVKPTEELKHEHQVVLLILKAAEREVANLNGGGVLHVDEVEKMIDFFQNFTDRCHHAKEEKHLFPSLQQHGLPVGSGPVAVMLAEHEEGRKLVRAIIGEMAEAKSGARKAIDAVRDNLASYIILLRQHIQKEDNVLFPMADRLIPADEQQLLTEAFARIEAEEIGEGTHEKYHQLAHDLNH
jgi:hemerythrin-like domain-containing protein